MSYLMKFSAVRPGRLCAALPTQTEPLPLAFNMECETGNYHTFCPISSFRGFIKKLKIVSF